MRTTAELAVSALLTLNGAKANELAQHEIPHTAEIARTRQIYKTRICEEQNVAVEREYTRYWKINKPCASGTTSRMDTTHQLRKISWPDTL